MIDWKSKLTSRKFWVALAGFVTGLIVAFGGTDATASQVAALIMSGASVVAYIIGEGLADAASAGNDSPIVLHTDPMTKGDLDTLKQIMQTGKDNTEDDLK